jgi:Protein of unknown function (DUF3489)
MPKSARKNRKSAPRSDRPDARVAHQTARHHKIQNSSKGSKQSRVIAMLQSPTGTTIAAMIKATGWQQHSVRGFLAGVVSKRLKLKLGSSVVDGKRIYRIANTGSKTSRSVDSKVKPNATRQNRS